MIFNVTSPTQPAPGDAVLSSSFAADGPPSFELKFLIDAAKSAMISAWARASLSPDPHGDPALAGCYEVSTLYLDTPRFDVFHGAKELGGAKFRLRRYGSDAVVYLERKQRRGDQVHKRRTPVPEKELGRLESPSSGTDWPGAWFQDEIEAREFQPACLLTYVRAAYYHPTHKGHLRLTLDRAIRCSIARGWSVERVASAGAGLLAEDQMVCELKFRETMPQEFKQLVAQAGLTAGRFSKYRQACRATGLVNEEEARDA